MQEDLERERVEGERRVRGDVGAAGTGRVTEWLDGGRQRTERRRELRRLVERDETFSLRGQPFARQSRPERYESALRKAAASFRLKKRLRATDEEAEWIDDAVVETPPTYLHDLMFLPALKSLFTDRQLEKWLPACESMEIIGCYAQTELGHGSNVRGIETTATYIEDSDEFEIWSPTPTSAKWWPGTLGRTANHCLLIAQLVIGGKSYGLHNFLVPIRDLKTHLPLKGVSVGDIGPKLGFNTMDNGFARFHGLRIPRENMAMRYTVLGRGGGYTSRATGVRAKIAYLTMTRVRAFIIRKAGYFLAQAATIAIRYSAVRRQGFAKDGGKYAERQVLDYTTQLHKLLPCLAAAYAFHFTGCAVGEELKSLVSALAESTPRKAAAAADPVLAAKLAEFHAVSSGLKSLCSTVASQGMEDCRQACGGHGYLQSSAFPELICTYLQNVTVEGENTYIPQQTASYLLKTIGHIVEGGRSAAVTADCAYHRLDPRGRRFGGSGSNDNAGHLMDLDALLEAYEHRSCRLVRELGRAVASDATPDAWNHSLPLALRASHAHSWLLVLRRFREAVLKGLPGSEIFWDLFRLLALHGIEKHMGDFTEDGFLSFEQAQSVRRLVVEHLHRLRPCAVSLVDAWDLSDAQLLHSTLGRKDGLVYEALMAQAKRSALNAEEPGRGILQYLKPALSRL